MADKELRFVCDRMLGTLCKWLRLLGLNAEYPSDVEDEAIGELALREDRILLTRDKVFAERTDAPSLLITSMDTDEQLREVDAVYHIVSYASERQLILRRCSVCNHLLSRIEKEEVRGEVPKRVREEHDVFWHCSRCGRNYWSGSHYGEILKKIETLK